MTVKELIEKLQKCPQDAVVCVSGNNNTSLSDAKIVFTREDDSVYIVSSDSAFGQAELLMQDIKKV